MGSISAYEKSRARQAAIVTIYSNGVAVGTLGQSFNGYNFSSAFTCGIAFGIANIDLATSGVAIGTYGSSTQVGQFTVDAYGRITFAANVTIAGSISAGSMWQYKAKTTATSGYPGDGYMLWDNATQTSAAHLIFAHLTTDNFDIDLLLGAIASGQTLIVQDQNDSGNYQKWTVSGTPTNTNGGTATSYWTVPVTLSSSAGTGTTGFANNHQLIVFLIGGGGSTSKRFIVPFVDSTQSTKYNSTTKLLLGSKKFDPNDTAWGLSGASTATLHILLAVTNSARTAQADLYQQTGTGSPTVVGTTGTTNATTATELTLDVSTAFRPGANAGIFNVRCWIDTFNGNDQTTCYGAWLEITP